MPYTDRFISTDSLIVHLQTFVGAIADPVIQSYYAGFLSVSAVTVYELAIKDIFTEFAQNKNRVFGNFVEKHFSRINGRIKLDALRGEHLPRFGDKYLNRFDRNLGEKERVAFSASHISITAVFTNLIICRHTYVHSGMPTLTINEVISNYNNGKEVIHCLNDVMKR